MKIISFAKTTPALLAGRKTVTRRAWTAKHAAIFHAGDLCQAWDHVPRVKGAHRVGTIELISDPWWEEPSARVPFMEYDREGFSYLAERGQFVGELLALWARWRAQGSDGLWVVEFRLIRHACLGGMR